MYLSWTSKRASWPQAAPCTALLTRCLLLAWTSKVLKSGSHGGSPNCDSIAVLCCSCPFPIQICFFITILYWYINILICIYILWSIWVRLKWRKNMETPYQYGLTLFKHGKTWKNLLGLGCFFTSFQPPQAASMGWDAIVAWHGWRWGCHPKLIGFIHGLVDCLLRWIRASSQMRWTWDLWHV